MGSENNRIKELESEIARLKAELEKTREQSRELEASQQATVIMLEDLDEAKTDIEKAKREWEETFDAISDPLFIHDKGFKIIRCNKAYAEAAGMTFNHFIGKPYYEVFPKMDGPFKMCKKALELQEEEEQEEEEFSCPVTSRIFKVRFYPIKDIDNKLLYSIHIMEDITEAKKAKDRIRSLNMQIEFILGAAKTGLDIIDSDFNVRYIDPEWKKVYGDPAGKKCHEYFMGRNEVCPGCGIVKALETKAPAVTEEILVKEGNRPIQVTTIPFQDADGKWLVAEVNVDITERKKAEDKIKQEMEITAHLLMISDAVAHVTDVDKVLEQTVHCGHEIMKCDVCLSYLWDKETNKFSPCKEIGLPHNLIPFFMTETLDEDVGFVEEAMGKGEPVTIQYGGVGAVPRTAQKIGAFGERTLQWLPDISILAAIPLISRKEPLGIIIGIYKKEIQITDRDEKIMQGISHQVSTALEQARLYRESTDKSMELSNRIQTIQVMHEIDRSILSTLESQEILETVTRLISRVISCERATVAIIDKQKQGFVYQAGFGVTSLQKGAFVPFEDTNAADVIKTGRPQYISNLNDIKDLPSLENRLLQDGFLSHIRVPLVIKEEIDGVLSIGSKRASAFTKEDLATLEKIALQIGVALENASLVSDLKAMFIGIVTSLSSAIDAKSEWTAGHSQRVTEIAVEIGMAMGLNKETLEKLEIAGLLHDVGKIGTYEAILDKSGKLNDEEMKMIKQHPSKGAEILLPMKQFKDIIPAVKHHHEFYDGTGYPDGLKGEDIPFLARIICVADAIDAMGADRPYRKGKLMDAIVMELKRCSGIQFDPKVVEVFLNVAGKI